MHYLMLVTISLAANADSAEARSAVYDALINDDSFCGSGGRFGAPLSDWFVIGGRWSGYLAETLKPHDYRQQLRERFPQLNVGCYSERDLKPIADGLNALWSEFGGTGPSPFNRSGYEQEGYEDDAMTLSRELYQRVLAPHARPTSATDGGHCEFVDLDDEPLDEEFIGRKWLVVVDYHS